VEGFMDSSNQAFSRFSALQGIAANAVKEQECGPPVLSSRAVPYPTAVKA
jgi:hypothetical protein